MGIVLPFERPQQKTWHDGLSRIQLGNMMLSQAIHDDAWLDFFTEDEEDELVEAIETDLITLKCFRLLSTSFAA